MIVLGEISIAFAIWFCFVLAATGSWLIAYLHDTEDRSCLVVFGRHWVSACIGILFCWWLVGTYSAPFFTHDYVALALIAYTLTSWGIIYQLARWGLFLQSSRVLGLKKISRGDSFSPTYEHEWVCFVAVQTLLLVLWSLQQWRAS